MAARLSHRGPDSHGEWVDQEAGVGLGHARLSIQDLSTAGHQPMISHCGRYVISYNGEVYNFRELREQLAGPFYGDSDTEVVLAAFSQFGVRGALPRLNGMFAMAVWDRQERCLHLIRDRIGIKPLYHGRSGDTYLFASELKALHAHPRFSATLDSNSVSAFLQFGYVPGGRCIYSGVSQLAPGSIVTIKAESLEVCEDQWWSLEEVVRAGAEAPFSGTLGEAKDALRSVLSAAVSKRMVSDVPLGAFLSGGVDSSLVVALMQEQSTRPVRTFTMSFSETGFDESVYARAVAEQLGTEHTEMRVTPGEAQQLIPRLASVYDEPFADASQIPTCLLSELTRQHVTVSLSGDGGDELFCGYDRYRTLASLLPATRIPAGILRRLLGRGVAAVPRSAYQACLGWAAGRLRPYGFQTHDLGAGFHWLGHLLQARGPADLAVRLESSWYHPPLAGGSRSAEAVGTEMTNDPIRDMMAWDAGQYLPDDILVKVDRASMAASLEVRVPLLDHAVVEYASQLPRTWMTSHPQGKSILRELLYEYVPQKLIDRPKMGFGVPIGQWLRGPLRAWAESLLTPQALGAHADLNVRLIRDLWASHLSGKVDGTTKLWTILMLQAWLEKQIGQDPGK